MCCSTLAMSNAVFPSCIKYNIQYNSEWLLWLKQAGFQQLLCMGVPCLVWVWYLQAIQSFVSNSWKVDRTEVSGNQRKPLPTKINESMNCWSHWTYRQWRLETHPLSGQEVTVLKAWFTLSVRFMFAPWLISFLTIPTFPFLAAIMRAVSWES